LSSCSWREARRNRPGIPDVLLFTMRYTAVIASRVVLAFVVFAALVTSACAQGGQDTPSERANGGGLKDTSEWSNPVVRQEPTIQQDERQILTGVISDKEKSPCPYSKGPCTRILVEEDPDADCRGGRGPLEPGCEWEAIHWCLRTGRATPSTPRTRFAVRSSPHSNGPICPTRRSTRQPGTRSVAWHCSKA